MSGLTSMRAPIYLAQPYTHYVRGHVGAYLDACRLSAQLHRRYKTVIFSPIAHFHGMTTHGDLPTANAKFWRKFNLPFIETCGGCVVAKFEGWQESDGVCGEIADFKAQKKMVVLCDPVTLELESA